MGHSKDVVYTKDDAMFFANELLHRIEKKDFSENESEFDVNELAWRIRWCIEK